MTKKIVLDHGAGGGLSHELIAGTIAGTLGDVYVGEMEDSASVEVETGRIAVTTDSFVVDPVFFGNGDIGKIAVAGTVNDLAVSGADPRYLTLAVILEEGFALADFQRIIDSVRRTAEQAGVKIVAGDTKVVRRGEADGIFLNTTGVGVLTRPYRLSSRSLREGDQVIVTGFLGDHSIHLLSLREGLGFEQRVQSDCAVLNHAIADVLDAVGPEVRTIRDITRGGLGTVLNEFAQGSARTIELSAAALPVRHETAMAAEMLGVDPMYLANEGNLCIVVSPQAAPAALGALRGHPETEGAVIVGEVSGADDSHVYLTEPGGRRRTVDLLYGAQLPRLC
ncbi:hydrogenase expression/formation protein HypE [Streptomyces avermitilis]|uniref:Hydrogenase expression/formation protein HypE n=1 Tax=Streptomyces avermitilis TaxID=33903 RepID=A0A4D4MHR6_STRAX|nr:hydrogenase expression/formation protein HypE [Streptomyces avermitilis]GDY68377.1 hydrogenase expression/formation protein HypE [Streptomyces avermitilis]GDY71254.1 hydrogenase expression/formation protein HypE [Streptomyces avermitilis]